MNIKNKQIAEQIAMTFDKDIAFLIFQERSKK